MEPYNNQLTVVKLDEYKNKRFKDKKKFMKNKQTKCRFIFIYYIKSSARHFDLTQKGKGLLLRDSTDKNNTQGFQYTIRNARF